MAEPDRNKRAVDAVREQLRREDEVVRSDEDPITDDALDDDRGRAAAGDPERPDAPLGVPDDADPEERPGFPRDDPSHG